MLHSKPIHYTIKPWKNHYEILHDRKPNLSYLHVFGALCYPNNDSENLGKFQAKVDIGIFIGYAPKKKAYRIYNRRTQKIIETIHVNFDELTAEQLGLGPWLKSMTPVTSSSGLISNPILQQPCNPPPKDDWDHFFQPMFDEYFNPLTIVVSSVRVAAAPRVVDLAGSHVSTSIDQDAPSTSFPSTQDQEHSPIISQGNLRDMIICDLNKTPDLSQRPLQNCPKCENPIDGQYCQGCALLRKKFKKDLFTYCIENGIFQDTFEPSKDNINVVNALQEPFVVKQDPSGNSSQSPPQINHHCCYRCGDSLEDIFCHQCTCELCGKCAHYGYNCPSKVSIIPDPEPFNNQTIDELP
nr:retrovirus-related Pol polyprotein from transposon TNT 1-94 [Tanacetum cinerariifolium]